MITKMKNADSIINIEGKNIGEGHPVYFIADIAANHDGDINLAKELIYQAKEAGADAAKFQHFRAENIVSDVGFKMLGGKKSHQAQWSKSVFQVYQDASVSRDWTEILKQTCRDAGISFFTSPYDFETVDYIDPFVPAFKVGSGDITWVQIISHIAGKQKPYIIATGASSTDDVFRAISAGLSINSKLALLQCNTNYTGSLENLQYVQLNVLKTYREMFPSMILGLSDHTPGHATVLGAVALGGKIIEKHFTLDTGRIGPDHRFSMDPRSWREMVDRTRELEAALGGGVKKIEENEQETAILQRRSIRVNKRLNAGHKIMESDLTMLRPCPKDGIPPYKVDEVIEKTLNRDVEAGEHLQSCYFK
jgi:N-acetylneuraminate synthase